MSTSRFAARRGQTLVELMIALAIAAVIGTALTQLMLSQSRFFDRQIAERDARMVSRGALGQIVSELQRVEISGANGDTTGVMPSTSTRLSLRVPYAFGILCRTAGSTIALLLPTDSTIFAENGHAGWAWRDTVSGRYRYRTGGSITISTNAADAAVCTAQGVVTNIPDTRVVALSTVVPGGSATGPGHVMMVYRRVDYEFKASLAVAGRVGLFRNVVSGTEEELVAPFNATARFRYHHAGNAVVQDTMPAFPQQVRGVELVLDGMSERTPQGALAPATSHTTTSVWFRNRQN